MKVYSENRNIKPGVWADEILDSLALCTGNKDQPLNPKKTTLTINPIDYFEKLTLSIIPLEKIELPKDKNPDQLEVVVWTYRKASTERENLLLIKEKLSNILEMERIDLPSLSYQEVGRMSFFIRIAIIEKSLKPDFPPFIAGEKLFYINFDLNEFPTVFCKFSERRWPNALWHIDIAAQSPLEYLYSDEDPRVIIYLNEDVPDLVMLTKSSAARNTEYKAAHFILINWLYFDVAARLSQWVLDKLPKEELNFPEFEVDSIGYIVLSTLKKIFNCENFHDLKSMYDDDNQSFLMDLQAALKLSEGIKLRGDL